MRKFLLALFVLIAAAAVAALVVVRDYRSFLDQPLEAPAGAILWVAPGMGFSRLVGELERLAMTRSDWRWRLLGRLHAEPIRAGEYRIEAGTTPAGLLAQLAAGEVRRHRFTIVEGWTFEELRRALAADSRIRAEARDLDGPGLMARLGCDCPAEGRFLPETYFFLRGDSDFDLLKRAYQALEAALEAAWSGRDPDLPLADRDQLLVLASLVERETGRPEERARVAGVFVRRLERGMRLQTDPTVVYGLGPEFDGRIRRVHLQTDHPWNTYTRHGLPPTPIALPGRAALEAAARPAEGSALYFVSRGDGTHHFSDTLAEHNRAVDRYIRGRN